MEERTTASVPERFSVEARTAMAMESDVGRAASQPGQGVVVVVVVVDDEEEVQAASQAGRPYAHKSCCTSKAAASEHHHHHHHDAADAATATAALAIMAQLERSGEARRGEGKWKGSCVLE